LGKEDYHYRVRQMPVQVSKSALWKCLLNVKIKEYSIKTPGLRLTVKM